MLSALIVACIYIVVICVVAWVLVAVLGMAPLPPPIAGILPMLIWAIAAIVCLLILLHVVAGGLPPLMLTGALA
jgi:hypothetical protein